MATLEERWMALSQLGKPVLGRYGNDPNSWNAHIELTTPHAGKATVSRDTTNQNENTAGSTDKIKE